MHLKQIKKTVVSAMLIALAVSLSTFSFPVFASRCFPIQHLVNLISGIFLGPAYAVAIAFSTSLIRNLMGTGSLLAFPGSMIGAFCCGMIYRYTKNRGLTYLGEILGTGILGGMIAYPVAVHLMGKEAAVFTYVLPFLISTAGGSMVAALLIAIMDKSGVLGYLKNRGELR